MFCVPCACVRVVDRCGARQGVLASNLHVSDDATPQESLDVQAFVDATDDANMSEVEAVATFLAGRSNTELMHAAKAATTLHAPRVSTGESHEMNFNLLEFANHHGFYI